MEGKFVGLGDEALGRGSTRARIRGCCGVGEARVSVMDSLMFRVIVASWLVGRSVGFVESCVGVLLTRLCSERVMLEVGESLWACGIIGAITLCM